MDFPITLFPEQASTAAERVDALFWFLTAVSTVMTVLIAGAILYFAAKYRRRPDSGPTPRIDGSLRLELFWTAVPLVVGLVMFGWAMNVYLYIAQIPANAKEVYVVGKQWMWKVQHPGGQREINELHVPLGEPVKLILTSEDVIHSFYVPAFRIKVDVLPGRYVETWFQPTKTGVYHLFCAEYCGTGHSSMIGSVVVMEPRDFQTWLTNRAENSLALEGRKLFLKFQCVACHSADALARAPVLEGLYGSRVPLKDGREVIADEEYLRQSIVEPDAKIVAGYEPIMPSFKGQIEEEEIIKLIAFLKTLPPGGTPDRVDRAPPPEAERRATPEPQEKSKSVP
ncbi:MAG: cytochrome c oxidase subunit II [Thermoguttaceae bacterium]|jgi:cytochrome c oxidase subunit 2